MTCHNGRPGPDHEEKDCYKFFLKLIVTGTTYTNNTDKFVVIIGVDSKKGAFGNNDIKIMDSTTQPYASLQWQDVTGFTAGATPTDVDSAWTGPTGGQSIMTSTMLPKNLLIPPGMTVSTTASAPGIGFEMVQCATLDHALDIL